MKTLRTIGCVVFDIEEPFDLLIDWRGQWFVMEVKNPTTHGRQKGGSLMTKKQDAILATLSAEVVVVYSPREAVDFMAAVK